MSVPITPGLLVLHGNRLELLRDAVFGWMSRQPLAPLQHEVVLVQSIGVAEWLKMALAQQAGICASTRVELPARFLWRTCRQVLGWQTVPRTSPLDRDPLTWRLMALMPDILAEPLCEPLQQWVQGHGREREHALAARLADLFDQYQVYRSDWLADWAAGRDVLGSPFGAAVDVPAEQRWQPWLWRRVLRDMPASQQMLSRDRIQARLLEALDQAEPGSVSALPPRIVVFGMSHLPAHTLQTLVALSRHCQVLLAVPNPCRFHWGDLIDGRELLRAARHRHPLRAGASLAEVPPEQWHLHGHPLLAAWGRQGRDFIRLLDEFDDAPAARERLQATRIDFFDEDLLPLEGPQPLSLLQQVQARIRDLSPLAEHPASSRPGEPAVTPGDRSIVFHRAHGIQRELEVLHDQLLQMLAAAGPGHEALRPRDIIVMLPDVQSVAPAIEAVFGQYTRTDARFIPYQVVDQSQRGRSPWMVALEWLLDLPRQRCTQAELRGLLDVPAIARHLGLQEADLPVLADWIDDAGVRWGLDLAHRQALDLGACGDLNTWHFGLQRMMLGYAAGDGGAFAGHQPFAEVAGLQAALAGPLARLVERLRHWQTTLTEPATPGVWVGRLRLMLADFFDLDVEEDRTRHMAALDALEAWSTACDDAGYDGLLSLDVVREAWLPMLDDGQAGARFIAGGVTFCTLMPMRAIPFEVVCLLGMNEGDYPRRAPRSDFDLLGVPGTRRPGDRARRDDDRYLMLEALLSARRTLYVSWTGHAVRDNTEQPPSVLVSQLRDHLAAGWGAGVLDARTFDHPLQPFSRRYFESTGPLDAEGASGLFTHAREWRQLHERELEPGHAADADVVPVSDGAPAGHEPQAASALPMVSTRQLTDLLAHPQRTFARERLALRLIDPRRDHTVPEDDEPFGFDALQTHQALEHLVEHAVGQGEGAVGEALERLQREGRLPLAEPGRRLSVALGDQAAPLARRWRAWLDDSAPVQQRLPWTFAHAGIRLDGWLEGARLGHDGAPSLQPFQAEPQAWWQAQWRPGRLAQPPRKKGTAQALKPEHLRPERFLGAWVTAVMAAVHDRPLHTLIMGRDLVVHLPPPDAVEALAAARALLQAWADLQQGPLQVTPRAAMAWAAQILADKPDEALASACQVFEGEAFAGPAPEGQEVHVRRFFPDFEALTTPHEPFMALSQGLYLPMLAWLQQAALEDLHAPLSDDEGDDPDE